MSSNDAFWLTAWEWTATIGFVLVIVGVVIEGVEHFKKFTKKQHARKLHIEKIGWLILVAGLALEFLAEHAAKRISDRENSRLNKEAGDARKEASDANILAKQLEANNLMLRTNVAVLEEKLQQTSSLTTKNDPLNLPIRSITARVYLTVLATNSASAEEMNADSEIALFGGHFDIISKSNSVAVMLSCTEYQTAGYSQIPSDGRHYKTISMVFSWPTTEKPLLSHIDKFRDKNISTKELDNEMVGAVIFFPECKVPLKITEGACTITINGTLERSLLIPNHSDKIFPLKRPNTPQH